MTLCISGPLNELAPALVAAQGELQDASKTSENPHFRSKYADLAEVLQTIRPVLSRHGLALLQAPGTVFDGKVSVTSMLLHKSGQWIYETLQVPLGKADAQGVVAAVTYGRRCGAAALVGIGQDDDDGESVVGRGKGGKPKASRSAESAAPSPSLTLTAPELAKAFQDASDGEELRKLAPKFAALGPEDQAKVLPDVKAARARLGL